MPLPTITRLFTEMPAGDVPGDQPRTAAPARRAGLRRAAPRPARPVAGAAAWRTASSPRPSGCSATARGRPIPCSTSRPRTSTPWRGSAPHWRACRSRSSSLPPASACSPPPCCWSASTSDSPLLVGSARDLPDRQRTIEATIEWSVGLLDAATRDLLVRLGVFAGDFSLEAVEAVGADAEAADRHPLAPRGSGRQQPRPLAGRRVDRPVRDAGDRARVRAGPAGGRARMRRRCAGCTRASTRGWLRRRRRCCRAGPSWRRSNGSGPSGTTCGLRAGICCRRARSRPSRGWSGTCSSTGGSAGSCPKREGGWMPSSPPASRCPIARGRSPSASRRG